MTQHLICLFICSCHLFLCFRVLLTLRNCFHFHNLSIMLNLQIKASCYRIPYFTPTILHSPSLPRSIIPWIFSSPLFPNCIHLLSTKLLPYVSSLLRSILFQLFSPTLFLSNGRQDSGSQILTTWFLAVPTMFESHSPKSMVQIGQRCIQTNSRLLRLLLPDSASPAWISPLSFLLLFPSSLDFGVTRMSSRISYCLGPLSCSRTLWDKAWRRSWLESSTSATAILINSSSIGRKNKIHIP